MELIPCLITTKHKGVLLGFINPETIKSTTIEAFRARFCVYWSKAMKGVLGLAVMGPDRDCRIGPSVESCVLHDVTGVFRVTEAALRAWEVAPWTR